ncbi:MAG: CDP-glycerol glycerophosphotransferase family protein [Simkaniaceae bacterium]|nr:CDP-glycerol glycerophosphotransferase family protein [Candidatus Sacchlamyda saccharinae]
MSTAGLIYGPEFHHLDHLAPLCSLMAIPLILSDEKLVAQAKQFYPDLEVLHCASPDQIALHFDTLIYSTPRVLFEEVFFFAQEMQKKRIKTIWCPHGNSDKGRHSPFMEALEEEELILTYGPRIEEFLKEKGVDVPTQRVGNYRLAYFEKHRAFYEKLFAPKKNAILYAPTWQDQEQNSSFPDLWPHLLEAPENLYVKLHPNLYLQFPEEIEKLKAAGVQFIEDFPPIYPLLAQIDLFIGDLSSIGYDFLAFKKPMILLMDSELTKAGRFVAKENYKNLFAICKEELKKTPPENTLYEETFNSFVSEGKKLVFGN